MKKRRIVIASVLKPVDDTRMFEKMAMTMSDSGIYEVFIIGQPSKVVPAYPNVHFQALKAFSRFSLGRLLVSIRIQKILHQVQPDIILVNTHELLIVAILNRILFGVKILYDVRENYFRNILYTEAFPVLLRPFVAAWVRLKEKIASPFIHLFLLAEKGYQKEMSFFAGRSIIIENKTKPTGSLLRHPAPGEIRLLFSGTLAESTGVLLAVRLAKKLYALNSAVRLTIIGYCAKAVTLRKIRSEIDGQPYIQLSGGDQLVPHPEIMEAICHADFGMVCYPTSRHTENAIPTKLYEYLACRLPILLQKHQPWIELCSPYQACVPLDFSAPDPAAVLHRMKSPFYVRSPEGIFWDSEARKLLAALEMI